jgi:hypothetical protein
MKHVTKAKLVQLPRRTWVDTTQLYQSLIVLPTGKVHDSGYGKMLVVGCRKAMPTHIISDCSDDLEWDFGHHDPALVKLRTDCWLPARALHFWIRKEFVFRPQEAMSSLTIKIIRA